MSELTPEKLSTFKVRDLPGRVVIIHELADRTVISELGILDAVVLEGSLQSAIARARQGGGMD